MGYLAYIIVVLIFIEVANQATPQESKIQLFLLFLKCVLISCNTAQALTDLYDATGGNSWTIKTNWLNGDPCAEQWHGVNCSIENAAGVVISL